MKKQKVYWGIAIIILVVFFVFFFEKRSSVCSSSLHRSFVSSKDFFNKAYERSSIRKSSSVAVGAVVNHHLLAPHFIAGTLGSFKTDDPITIVLISPNHFLYGASSVIVSGSDWETPFGILRTDCDVVKKLEANKYFSVNETPFKDEHGIGNIVAFIKHDFPSAQIVSLIIRDNLPDIEIQAISSTLWVATSGKALVIGSFDFSHGQSRKEAEEEDVVSKNIIKSLNPLDMRQAYVDSRSGLSLVVDYAVRAGADRFEVVNNSNSSRILNNTELLDVTSYITGIFYK